MHMDLNQKDSGVKSCAHKQCLLPGRKMGPVALNQTQPQSASASSFYPCYPLTLNIEPQLVVYC